MACTGPNQNGAAVPSRGGTRSAIVNREEMGLSWAAIACRPTLIRSGHSYPWAHGLAQDPRPRGPNEQAPYFQAAGLALLAGLGWQDSVGQVRDLAPAPAEDPHEGVGADERQGRDDEALEVPKEEVVPG